MSEGVVCERFEAFLNRNARDLVAEIAECVIATDANFSNLAEFLSGGIDPCQVGRHRRRRIGVCGPPGRRGGADNFALRTPVAIGPAATSSAEMGTERK
ncbi:hypothetical protein [Nocardia nova]|uniref:hypothetical protein n=1 Tax=Nocardia nova TaxID=37330 RepID=UPI00340C46DD